MIINGIRIYSKNKEVFGISDDDGKRRAFAFRRFYNDVTGKKAGKENDAKDEEEVSCEVETSGDTSSLQLVGNQGLLSTISSTRFNDVITSTEACNNILSASLLAMERLVHTNFKVQSSTVSHAICCFYLICFQTGICQIKSYGVDFKDIFRLVSRTASF